MGSYQEVAMALGAVAASAAAGLAAYGFAHYYNYGQTGIEDEQELEMLPVEVLQDQKRLRDAYTGMVAKFRESGLDIGVISKLKKYYSGLEEASGTLQEPSSIRFRRNSEEEASSVQPLRYVDMDPPLAEHAVRLLVIPLMEDPKLGADLMQLNQEVIDLLPKGTKVYSNPLDRCHITVFFLSRSGDTRPNPSHPNGDIDLSLPDHKRRGPTPQELDNELSACMSVIGTTPPPELILERIFMADSGTLLCTWVDSTGGVAALRAKLTDEVFVGASPRQTNIIHTSLCRVLSELEMTREEIDAVADLCDAWTEKLKGLRFKPSKMWLIYETYFSIIFGEQFDLPMKT